MAYKLPSLPYDYDALEPHIDERTMKIHHDKHHGGYTRKTNNALEGHEFADLPIEEVLQRVDELPDDIRQDVVNNGGGYSNHSLFWTVMSPNGGGEPTGEVADAINDKFGSFESFKDAFGNAATGRFGSGWAWLVVDGNGDIEVINTLNQNSPYMEGYTPILGLDVWEHAYYLNYQNERGAYVDAFWNVVDWDQVNKYYNDAK